MNYILTAIGIVTVINIFREPQVFFNYLKGAVVIYIILAVIVLKTGASFEVAFGGGLIIVGGGLVVIFNIIAFFFSFALHIDDALIDASTPKSQIFTRQAQTFESRGQPKRGSGIDGELVDALPVYAEEPDRRWGQFGNLLAAKNEPKARRGFSIPVMDKTIVDAFGECPNEDNAMRGFNLGQDGWHCTSCGEDPHWGE